MIVVGTIVVIRVDFSGCPTNNHLELRVTEQAEDEDVSNFDLVVHQKRFPPTISISNDSSLRDEIGWKLLYNKHSSFCESV